MLIKGLDIIFIEVLIIQMQLKLIRIEYINSIKKEYEAKVKEYYENWEKSDLF